MDYKMSLSVDELVENVKGLSSPEVKEGISKTNFNTVKDNFIDIIKNRYFCFEGVAKRSEYWQYVIVPFVLMFACAIISTVLGIILGAIGYMIGSALIFLVSLALICPSLGVTARRLHDTGKSGWLQLIGIVPFIGSLIVLALCLGKSVECSCGCGCEQK